MASCLVAATASTRRSASSGSIVSGNRPQRPSMTALSVRWPRPVQASEPSKVAFNRPRLFRCSASRPPTKAAAAFIGPTVCEDDGPIPILNRSKTLIMTDELPSRGPSALLRLQPRNDFARDHLDLVGLVLVGHEDDLLNADGVVGLQLLDAIVDRAHDRAVARAVAVSG